MDMVSILQKKVKKQELSPEEIAYLIQGVCDGSIPDYQISAFLMAVRLNGMTFDEMVRLTIAMEKSGDECDLSCLDGIPVDKHSTGGVGDTTSLICAPLVAACGLPVAKMSGRGLGHTGGTLDKMESIPGMKINLSEEAFIEQVKKIGIAIIGQTERLNPADKLFYALRDVTATVDSLPLICSSIISKKLASGARGIVLDVKTGTGSLMKSLEDSIELASCMVKIGCSAGRNVVALVTGLDEPLGTHVGNALEVKEAIDVLSGRTKGALLDVSLEIGAQMMITGKAASTAKEAKALLTEALESGRGLEKLRQLIAAQGGNPAVCDDTGLLPQPNVRRMVCCPVDGYLTYMNTIEIGNTAQSMGAGRRKKDDVIDPSVGFVLFKHLGDRVQTGEPLAELYARSEESAAEAEKNLLSAITFGNAAIQAPKMIYALVNQDSILRF